MKILIVNYFYNKKSVGFIIKDCLKEYIINGHQVYLAVGDVNGNLPPHSIVYSKPYERMFYMILNRFGRLKFAASRKAAKRVISFIKSTRPDIVHIHLPHCYSLDLYYLLNFLAENSIKTVLTHHSEFYYTGSCAHAYGCRQFIDNQCAACRDIRRATGARCFGAPNKHWLKLKEAFDRFSKGNLAFTAVSPWVLGRSLLSPIVRDFLCTTVMNGIDTTVFNRNNHGIADIRSNLNSNYILHVSASFNPNDKDDIKGGYFVLKMAELLPDKLFYVISSDIHYVESLPSNIVLLGSTNSQLELSNLYKNATLTLLTSKKETFSMVCAESLCCGTPIVGFKAGGPESIAIMNYCKFVDYGDINRMKDAIVEICNTSFDRDAISALACMKYSKEEMAKKYLDFYNSLNE